MKSFMTRPFQSPSLLVALFVTSGILIAQPVFEEKETRELVICSHPEAARVSGFASPEFLAHDPKQRQVLVITQDNESHRKQLAAVQRRFAQAGSNSDAIDAIRIGAIFTAPEVIGSAYPPDSQTPYYSGDQISQKYLWRSLGWIAPDLVIVWKEGNTTKIGLPKSVPASLRKACRKFHQPDYVLDESHLASAAITADPPPAGVGNIPAIEFVCPADFLNRILTVFLAQLEQHKLPEISSAHQEMLNRRKRTPLEIAEQLDKVYGHHLNKVIYQPALSLIARLNLDDLQGGKSRYKDVEKIVADYASGKKPTLGDRPSGSVTAGHLIFVELAHRADKEKYLPLVKRAADQIFDVDGKPGPVMPAHSEMSDAVFMGAPILAAAGNLTGNKQYYDLCLKHVRFMQKLCLREDGIYRHSPLDEAAWGRGNGFPALGLALVLSEIPESHPVHQTLREDLQKHLKALCEHQDPTGMWHQVIDEPGAYREMTSTCMISFAILRGLRNGWLEETKFAPVIERSMPAIKDRIAPNGELIDVCTGTGKQKNLLAYYDRPAILGRDERGGAMAFMAVTEYARYLQEQQP
jgi:rhamnogalacturonyl hydrolase YesR